MKRLKWTVVALILGLTLLGMSSTRTAQAKSLSFKALTYGTTKTSIASAYFVHPASVTVHNHKYVVTMHIRTAKKLSAFPVKVLQVNGHSPQRVRRVTDKAGNSNVYYSFTTKSLAKAINAKLAINVPKVYKATHMISFKFSQAHLPSLKTTRHAKASTEPVRQITDSSDTVTKANQTSQVSSHRLKTISDGTTPTNGSTSQSVSSRATQSSTQSTTTSTQSRAQNTPSQSSQSQASSSVTVASADHADQSATPLNWWFLIGGVTVIVIMVVGGGLVIVGRHGRGR